MNIPITKPYFGPEEALAVQKPIETGWVVQGPYVKQFEEKFSTFTGAAYSAATSSCTTALHAAVAALDLKPGDEVIVPAFTFIATSNVVEYMGAKPVFCDINLRTFNIDVHLLESLITPRTVGIIPVHLFGLCADIAAVLRVAQKYHLWVVEDAACAFGAKYDGRHAGVFGQFGCFSFHPRKSITTGEGGMVTTQDARLDERVRVLRDQGASQSVLARHTGHNSFLMADFEDLGYNYRMTDIQGALGCAQMDKASYILANRSRLARRYDDMLAEVPWLQTPSVPAGYVHGYQSYVCLFSSQEPTLQNLPLMNQRRNQVMRRLEDKGIVTRQGTHAAALLGYYTNKYGYKAEQFPQSCFAEQLSCALPLFVQMTVEEQDTVVRELLAAY